VGFALDSVECLQSIYPNRRALFAQISDSDNYFSTLPFVDGH
jgi:hypothetical protein